MCFSIFTMTLSVYSMDNIKYFKDLFESILDYREIVLLVFLIENDVDLIIECG